jgi:hypothetical protein
MATYTDLRTLDASDDLKNRLDIAVTVEAHILATGTPTAEDTAWSGSALASPRPQAMKALRFVVAANKDLTLEGITGMTDAALQAQVALSIPVLVASL